MGNLGAGIFTQRTIFAWYSLISKFILYLLMINGLFIHDYPVIILALYNCAFLEYLMINEQNQETKDVSFVT